jgi:hypothetical protein
MSHVVTIRTEVRDGTAVGLACRRLKLPEPTHETVRLYSETVTGLAVRLPDWRYPVVCDLSTGQVRFDNFEGRWGDQADLHRFVQMYAVEKAKLEARKQGHAVFEQPLADGSIRLSIQVGEGT